MKKPSNFLHVFAILLFLFCLLMGSVTHVSAQEEQGSILPDAFVRPPEVQTQIAAAETGQALSGPGYYDTSVYMTGSVAVGIILPESAGNQENWTTTEKNTVVSQIQAGMNWWKTQGGIGANLTFYYDLQLGIPTQYEPITMSTSQEDVWIGDVLNNMGYSTSASYWNRIYAYDNYLRTQYNTNWAFTIFVVRDASIPAHTFSNGYFAYAYIGGPFMVMTYNNDGWGISNMQWVAAHETGHIFGAGDQYYQAGYGGCTSKTDRYGYLGIQNSNCDYGGATGIASIMKKNSNALDASAHDQVGWRDSNSNGIPDPIDRVVINLTAHAPNPTAEVTLTYSGSAQLSPYPHAVCTGANDLCYDHDVNIQTISNVEYRTDGGAWFSTTPADGAFNSEFESFTFAVSLGSGTHVFNICATTSVGATTVWSDTVASTVPLGVGKYDDTNLSWTYSDGWTTYSGTGPYNGTIHYTGSVGASAYFRFSGQQYILTYTANSNRGSFEVWVDGVKEITINAYNTTLVWQRTYTSPMYSAGAHTVMVKNIGGGTYVDVDAIQIDPDRIAPSAVGSLSASTGTSSGSVDLNWMAPMNDAGNPASGPVSAYLVRYSPSNIVSESDWNAATPVTRSLPTPGAVGADQGMTVSGLAPGIVYYIAVRGQDATPNIGPIVTASAMPKTPSPVAVGLYDDSHIGWMYSGAWNTYAGVLHYTDALNAAASFTFTGAQFVLTYTGASNRGSFEVWVDGSLVTTVNAYSATLVWQRTYVSPPYASGVHTVVFKNVSGRTDVDAIQVIDRAGAGNHDDVSAYWVYGGAWNTYAGAGPYAGTLHYTDAAGATATFLFTGIQFVLTYTGDANRGSFEVWVDGSLVTTVDAYNPTVSWQRIYISPIYAPGDHTVVFKNVSGRTDVDGIQVNLTQDALAPSAVGGLAGVTGAANGTVDVSWTAPMNDAGNAASGPVNQYQVRYSLTSIASESDWNGATPVTMGIPRPGAVGAAQAMTVAGLTPGLGHFIAVRGQDIGLNLGPIVTVYAVAKPSVRMGAGIYDDMHTSWVYGGAWNTYAGAGPYAGTLHYTDGVNATASFVFTGVQFVLTYTSAPNRGSFEVWVDGLLVTTVDAYNASTNWQRTYISPIFGTGEHTVVFKRISGRTDVDGIRIIESMGAGVYDDTHAAWAYSGTWNTYASTGPYAGTIYYTDAANATATFLFTGAQFVLTYTGAPNRGSFEVWVDGSLVTTVNAYSATLVWQRTYVSPVYPVAVHTVVFKNISGRTDVDAMRVIVPMGAGTYDDANTAWAYGGTWNTWAGTGPYAGTMHYTDAANATATFLFSGTQFVLTYTGDSNRGSFEVWVDGSLVTTVNAYSATLVWQRTYVSPTYASGVHTVVFKNISGRTDVDALRVVGPMSAGAYDDADAAWVYGGTWNTWAGTGPYAGTLHYTDTAGATATFLFTGAQFILTYTGDSNRGSFEVWVDGSLVTTVNAYSASVSWQRKYTSPIYPSGVHTVVFKNISGRTDVDGLQILDTLGTGTYDDVHAAWVYGGTWNTYAGAGPYAGTLHYTDAASATATFLFTGTQFVLTYTGASNRGSFEVWMDGSLVTTVSAYNATTVWQRTYISPVYASGVHTVVFKNLSSRTDVDAIKIMP